jgi:hypothetical protein
MKYTVIWLPGAEAELANLWIDETFRKSTAEAARRIDRTLERDPEAAGESRDAGLRILIEPPLAVTFRVSSADRLVVVLNIWSVIARG